MCYVGKCWRIRILYTKYTLIFQMIAEYLSLAVLSAQSVQIFYSHQSPLLFFSLSFPVIAGFSNFCLLLTFLLNFTMSYVSTLIAFFSSDVAVSYAKLSRVVFLNLIDNKRSSSVSSSTRVLHESHRQKIGLMNLIVNKRLRNIHEVQQFYISC